MTKRKKSGPAIFMYSAIVLTALVSLVCLSAYYSGVFTYGALLWTGIVSFMILYHFGLRIFFGELTKRLKVDLNHPWYRERKFEKKLYKILKVKKWKNKVPTFEPEKYDLKKVTLDQLAANMAKSEIDHWINELISVSSVLFALLWGQFAIFVVTAVLAMLFDAQFIAVQRYNRPIVLCLMERKNV